VKHHRPIKTPFPLTPDPPFVTSACALVGAALTDTVFDMLKSFEEVGRVIG